jgi:glycerol-3-phosphate acyltransferase PlsY
MEKILLAIITAYLLGSLSTGVWVSRRFWNCDIRDLGDGNTGARNTTHILGWKAGIMVAVGDFAKGALAVIIARQLGISMVSQLLMGIAVVIGHDFPVFTRFKGGQGMATALGTMSVLFTPETLDGLAVFGLLYVMTRNFEISASAGLGTLALLVWRSGWPSIYLLYIVALFLSILLKKLLDLHFRKTTPVNLN